jgi:hypothetical protein
LRAHRERAAANEDVRVSNDYADNYILEQVGIVNDTLDRIY